jgi:hypothetical protein
VYRLVQVRHNQYSQDTVVVSAPEIRLDVGPLWSIRPRAAPPVEELRGTTRWTEPKKQKGTETKFSL